MRQYVRQYKKSMPIRALALSVIDNVAQPGQKNYLGQVRALHSFVKNNIAYVRDINGVETLATPINTLKTRKGDCDDQATLLAALLESVGHPTRFVAIKQNLFGPYVHVFAETKVGNRWLPVETTENWPVGKHPPEFKARMVVTN